MADPTTFLTGTLDMLVLRTLADEPMHGYGIAALVRRRTGGTLTLQDAALYQSLRRLERRGVIESSWRITENKRRARYYALTARGEAELRSSAAAWREYARAVLSILETASEAER